MNNYHYLNKWKNSDKVYTYDSSIEGLFTIIYRCINFKEVPKKIINEADYEINLLEEPIFIETNLNDSQIIFKKLSSISDFTLYTTFTSFLSNKLDKDLIILKYILKAFKYGTQINSMRNKDYVINMRNLHRQVKNEAHRLKGFLRFSELSNKILYAEIEPENNIIEFLAEHFSKRLAKEYWIIHDLKRNLIAVYNDKNIIYENAHILNKEKFLINDEYEELWKNYFKIIGIKERRNRRCQLNFMPKKYWKHMVEMKDEV